MNERTKMIEQSLNYKFTNQADDDRHILTLSGVVAKQSFFNSETINAKDIREALNDVDKDIVIQINSGGGDVFEGVEIYNYIKGIENNVTIEITSLAASAASIIAMAADKVLMHTGSSMMIHEASTIAFGNKGEIQKTLNALETVDASITSIYKEKVGLSTEEIEDLIKAETWFTADEAVEKGFADGKVSKPKKDDDNRSNEPQNVINDNDSDEVADLKKKINALETAFEAMSNGSHEDQKQKVTNQKRKLYL